LACARWPGWIAEPPRAADQDDLPLWRDRGPRHPHWHPDQPRLSWSKVIWSP